MNLELLSPPAQGTKRTALDYARAAVHGLVRMERRGEVKPRLTDPGLATWQRFRGRLGARHLLELLLQDAAVVYPIPFDAERVLGSEAGGLASISDAQVEAWAKAAQEDSAALEDADAHLLARARELGLPARLARSELHKVKPHHKVLELPGTGGLLAQHVLTENAGLFLAGAFHVACASWQELVVAGLVAVEHRAVRQAGQAETVRDVRGDPKLLSLREPGPGREPWRYDVVIGLAPAKGGAYALDDLARWFHGASIQLV